MMETLNIKACLSCKHYTGYECLIRKAVIVSDIADCGTWEGLPERTSFCPLIQKPCLEDSCEWWMFSEDTCAIWSLAASFGDNGGCTCGRGQKD